jgi:hypothetical protein
MVHCWILEEGEMEERCKESRDWIGKIARKRGRFGGEVFCLFTICHSPSNVLAVLKYTNWVI